MVGSRDIVLFLFGFLSPCLSQFLPINNLHVRINIIYTARCTLYYNNNRYTILQQHYHHRTTTAVLLLTTITTSHVMCRFYRRRRRRTGRVRATTE